jgi:hypothetical protein
MPRDRLRTPVGFYPDDERVISRCQIPAPSIRRLHRDSAAYREARRVAFRQSVARLQRASNSAVSSLLNVCESFMKTLKYEEVLRNEYRGLADARASIREFLEKSTTKIGSIPRSDTWSYSSLTTFVRTGDPR